MSNYKAGAQFERVFMQLLAPHEDHLYVIRSAGSHGLFDLIELRRDPKEPGGVVVFAYQLKMGKKFPRIASAEIAAMEFFQEMGIQVRIVWKRQYEAIRTWTVDEYQKQQPRRRRGRPKSGGKQPQAARKLSAALRSPSRASSRES